MGVDLALLKEVDRINSGRIQSFVTKVKKALWIVKNKKIAILGLAFKPETEDIRNTSSIGVIKELQNEGAILRLYDPEAINNMKTVFPEDYPKTTYAGSAMEAVEGANALLLITEWDEFNSLELQKVRELMANPLIIDGRNVFELEDVRKMGFEYYSVGRK